jgi:segregation and condensation protein A
MEPNYQIQLPIFTGPIDLLLFLVQKNELEISKIPISQITKEYLEYLHLLKVLNLELSSEFLLMAATLLRIKMKSLLPSIPGQEEEEEDLTQELARRLEEYRRFKEVASWLRDKEATSRNHFPHSSYFVEKEEAGEEKELEIGEVSLAELLAAFKSVLDRKEIDNIFEISPIPVTVEEKIENIQNLMREKGKLSFYELFERETRRIEMIVTFLALLELIRLRKVMVKQMKEFGEIWITEVVVN